ncbi:MAG: NAD(P)H-binding protein [Chitinophagaceae bacterium]|nr:NAD(P)H-binding protein [Chitinophagaceae bacterium]
MKVAIAGASGLTGSLCLEALLQHPEVDQVVAIVRRPLQRMHPKLQQVLLSGGELKESIVADAFISCLGTTIRKAGSREAFEAVDRHLPVQIARQLQRHGCQVVAVVSAMGASAHSRFFYNRVKGAMEDDLQQTGFASLSILRPSIIDGQRQESRPAERMALALARAISPLMGGKLRHYRAIEARTIAKALVTCVIQRRTGQFTYLSGDIETLAHL